MEAESASPTVGVEKVHLVEVKVIEKAASVCANMSLLVGRRVLGMAV